MKKTLKNVSKFLTGILVGIRGITGKVFATIDTGETQCLYGIRVDPTVSFLKNIVFPFVVPIILLTGLITYLIKRKNKILEKILMSLLAIMLIAVSLFIADSIPLF